MFNRLIRLLQVWEEAATDLRQSGMAAINSGFGVYALMLESLRVARHAEL